ncbi:MAG: hypothetical protein KAI71_04195 [Candidatus Pacebacteria bacterium]|nr:hypothetical protein [Candidatus Paceibacterota bacterium]
MKISGNVFEQYYYINMMYNLKINIICDQVSLTLEDKKGNEISKSSWIDKRDLSEKILVKIDKLLKKNSVSFSNLNRVDFNCDSPYFQRAKKISLNENISSKNRCGFMAWQLGQVTAKTMNLMLTKTKK